MAAHAVFEVVDKLMEIVDEFQGRILNLEHEVLLRPSIKSVRKRESLSAPDPICLVD